MAPAEHLETLDELPPLAACVELLSGEEVVVHAIDFAGADRAGSGRDTSRQRHRLEPDHPPHQRRLAHTRRTRDNHQSPAPAACHLHSTFCIISRIRSIAVLISITSRAISTSLAFDPMVFVSRSIS
jgi:hypothetical protein